MTFKIDKEIIYMVTIFAVEAYLLPIVGVAAALVAVLATLLVVRLLTSNE